MHPCRSNAKCKLHCKWELVCAPTARSRRTRREAGHAVGQLNPGPDKGPTARFRYSGFVIKHSNSLGREAGHAVGQSEESDDKLKASGHAGHVMEEKGGIETEGQADNRVVEVMMMYAVGPLERTVQVLRLGHRLCHPLSK